jgi:Rieske 2Fe-2S family protein
MGDVPGFDESQRVPPQAPFLRRGGFARAEYPLLRVPLATWQGFLFIALATDPEPVAAVYGRYDARFDPWGVSGLRLASRIEYDVRANWKLIVENYSDCFHCRAVHPELNRRSDYRNGSDDVVDGFLLGGYMWVNYRRLKPTACQTNCVGVWLVDGSPLTGTSPTSASSQRHSWRTNGIRFTR